MFQNPLLLFGLTAVSVPIIIHLLNRRKFERVVWAAMRFLRLAVEQNQRRVRIEDLLLLILRCLLVAILALALARPELRASIAGVFGATKVTAVIVIDNSYSMSRTDGTESSFQSAKASAERIINSLPKDASVAVVLASDIARELGEPTDDHSYVINQIHDATLYDRPTNLLEGIRSGMGVLKNQRSMAKELYVITDGQLSGWRQLDAIAAMLSDGRKADIRPYLIFVGKNEEQNLGISSMHLASGLTPVDQPVRVDVTVKNWGTSDAQNVAVSAGIDDEKATAQATIPTIPAGQEASITLRPTPRTEGFHTITASLMADRLPADDSRTVGLLAVKTIRLLMIEGQLGQQPRDGDLFYVRQALMPVRKTEREAYFIRPTIRSASDLSGIDFAEFDAVIAANVPDLADNTAAQLANYIRGGGGLILFPGEKVNRNFYNEQLFKRYGLLPAMLGQTVGDAKAEDKHFSLSGKSFDHEIVSIWKDPASGTLSSARFFKAYELGIDDLLAKSGTDAAAAGESRIVLKFADEKPAIVERDYGQGRVVMFASTANTAWNDLPPRGQFVPLMDRTLWHLLARKNEHLTVKVGEDFVHSLPARLASRDLRITKPKRSYAAGEGDETRRVELENGTPVLRFKGTNFAGAYQVMDNEVPVVRFAAQSDSEESSPQTLDPTQLRQLGNLATVIQADGASTLQKTLEAERGGTRLWMALIWIALALAATETLLAHVFSKSK